MGGYVAPPAFTPNPPVHHAKLVVPAVPSHKMSAVPVDIEPSPGGIPVASDGVHLSRNDSVSPTGLDTQQMNSCASLVIDSDDRRAPEAIPGENIWTSIPADSTKKDPPQYPQKKAT